MHDVPLTLAQAVRAVLNETGESFEIRGVGSLHSKGEGEYLFKEPPGPRVFLSYAREDLAHVRRLRAELDHAGFHPWMDLYEILPGQDWSRAIQLAIRLADFYVPCFSSRAVRKRGTFQRELRYALKCNEEVPLDDSFVVPIRLDECEVPSAIASNFQYLDLFPEWDEGVAKLITSIRRLSRQRC